MDGPGHIPCSVMVGSGTYCLHPAGVGGSQFTMTLWMGYSQTPEIENGDKPYACNKCTYRAAQQSDLTKHMRTHTGVKPYACNK